MKHKELKPCPLCDGVPRLGEYDPYDGYQGDNTHYVIICTLCGIRMENRKKNRVVELWNRRVNTGDDSNG